MLKRWASQHGAARALGLTSAGGISNVANVRGQAARGFRWRFASRSDEAVSSGDSARRDDSRGTAPGTVSVAAVAATEVAPLGSTQDDDGDPRPTAVPADMARRLSDLQANVQNAPSQLKGALQPRFMAPSPLSPINSPTPSDMRVMAIPGDVEAGAGGSADVAAIQQTTTRMPPRRSTISGSPSFQNPRALKDAPPEAGSSPTGAGSNAGDVENTRGPLEQLRSNARSHSIHIMRNKSADFANSAYSDLKRAAPVALRAKLESLGDRMADMCVKVRRASNDLVCCSVAASPQSAMHL